MNLHLILMVIASVCFFLVVLGVPSVINLTALGLLCWSLAVWIGTGSFAVPSQATLLTVLLILAIVAVTFVLLQRRKPPA